MDRGAVATVYSGTARAVVAALKYGGRTTLAPRLSTLLRAAGDPLLHDADLVVPVPLHPWRRLQRGFNQSAALAAGLGVPMRSLLRRVRPTPPQVGQTAGARRRNVRGAFAPARFTPVAARRAVDGRVVVLVDDVRTTGATLHECAVVLKAMGAREVRALALCHAPTRDALRDQRGGG